MTKQEKLTIYQDIKDAIDSLQNGETIWLGTDFGNFITIERDDMVEFQPTFLVDDYIMSHRPEIIALIAREIFSIGFIHKSIII